jgi:hypothetical protein
MLRCVRLTVAGVVWAVVSILGGWGLADEKARREQAVRGDRQAMSGDARWLYNDLETGFEAAKQTGKPLLVVLRCVPCKACTGIDESVVRAKELQPLLDRFICVRVINANALDLKRFQFDYDLSFSTMFFHSDGTLYGRFGSWQHQLDELEVSTAGFQAALERVLELHRDYANVRDALAPKQGGPTPFSVPIEIPGLAGKYQRELQWEGNVVQSCVHCHQIGDAYRTWYRQRAEVIPSDLIYPMPEPKTVGLNIDHRTAGKVRRVEASSIAEKSGFKPGDVIRAIDGAPMVSVADVAWALHRAPEAGTMRWTVLRDGLEKTLEVALPSDWRFDSDISARVGTWAMRAMALGGMVLRPLGEEQRAALAQEPHAIGLLVHNLGYYGEHAAAKNAGFQKGDVIVALEGFEGPITESRLIGELLRRYPNKTRLDAVVLRDGQRISLKWPIQ